VASSGRCTNAAAALAPNAVALLSVRLSRPLAIGEAFTGRCRRSAITVGHAREEVSMTTEHQPRFTEDCPEGEGVRVVWLRLREWREGALAR
jgi:hypothetical protein